MLILNEKWDKYQSKAWELQAVNSHKKRKFKPRMMSTNNQTKEEMEVVDNNKMMEEENSQGQDDLKQLDKQEPTPEIQRILPRYG
jgi:hypothetical protein